MDRPKSKKPAPTGKRMRKRRSNKLNKEKEFKNCRKICWKIQKTTFYRQKMQELKLKDKIWNWKDRNVVSKVATSVFYTNNFQKCREKRKLIVDFGSKAKVNRRSQYLAKSILKSKQIFQVLQKQHCWCPLLTFGHHYRKRKF